MWASAFDQWTLHSATSVAGPGTYTLQIAEGSAPVLLGGPALQPLATNAPLLVDSGASQELATPITVSCSWTPGNCKVTIALTLPHRAPFSLRSGTAGLQEAINYERSTSGTVALDPEWLGTSAMILASQGAPNVTIEDARGGGTVWFAWNGSAYISQNEPTGAVNATRLTVASPAISPTSLEGTSFADQAPTLQDAINALPPSGGVVQLACGSGGTNALAAPLVIVNGAVRLKGCGHDESGNGTRLVFTPPSDWSTFAWRGNQVYGPGSLVVDSGGNAEVVAAGNGGTSASAPPAWASAVGAVTSDGTVTWTQAGTPAAIIVLNGYGFSARDFSLSEGNTTAEVSGMALLGVHDADVEDFFIGGVSAGNFDFTGTGLLLADTASASAIYNSFRNFTVLGGTQACELLGANAGKSVNANVFVRGVCGDASQYNLDLTGAAPGTGNVSENTFLNLDVSGNSAPVHVQIGDAASNGQFRGNLLNLTEESDATAPSGQIGIENRGILSEVYSEGSLGGVSPVFIEDRNGGTHFYCHGASSPGCESTIAPLQFDEAGDFGLGVPAGTQGNSASVASGFGMYAGGSKVINLAPGGIELATSGGTWLADSNSGTLMVGTTAGASDGKVRAASAAVSGTLTAGVARLNPQLFANLPACTGGSEGSISAVIDATSNAWGSVIAGGGSNHVMAYCDGVQWTVAAK